MAMESHDTSQSKLAPACLSGESGQFSESNACADRVGDALRSGAPAPGGAAAPFLDIGCGNVPHKGPRKPWTRKQWLTRRVVLDRLNYWQAHKYQCLWVTLTSSPSSPTDKLRKDFQTLRKRMARQLGFENIQYVCVDTREGHGVLHIILAWKEGGQ